MTVRPATLIAVIPIKEADRLLESGAWMVGRSNQFTKTLYLEFQTEMGAMVVGRSLPFPWAVERMPAA